MSQFVRYGILFSLFINVFVAQNAVAESPEPDAAVEELRAVLKSIHPYLPDSEISSEIDIFGSTSMDSLAHGWAIGFKKFHPQANVVISAEGSETTFDRLAKNPGSIGMLSRPVTEADLVELKKRGLKQPVAVMVGRDALGVFVQADNPLKSISYGELVGLFCSDNAAEEVTWGSIGLTGEFADNPVVLIGRDSKSGTRAFLKNFVFRGNTMRATNISADSNTKLIAELEKNPHAIAISELKCGNHGARLLKLRANKSMIPSDDHSVLVGKYPLTRPLTLVLDVGQQAEQTAATREFVRYALSHAGQMQTILAGFFPFDPPTLRAELLKVDFQQGTENQQQPVGRSKGYQSTAREANSKLAR
jgi:phosphate transport system substrate-binding protein